MVFVTDPDDLDRWQVLLDPNNQTIAVKGLGADKYDIYTTGSGQIGQTFDDVVNGNFVASGIGVGDILSIASGANSIGHYTVSGSVTATTMAVQPSFSASEQGLSYKISSATPVLVGANGGTVSDGLTVQSLYSFCKEEFKTLSDAALPDLIKFDFPFISITREQFEIGGSSNGDWDFANDDTRNLMRTGGWAQINSAGTTLAEYTGIITLGSVDTDAQVYYLQQAAGTPIDFVLQGPVNQAIKTFTDGGSDFRGFLKLFVRKKSRSYAGSEISDIGVTSIETIVNRFPLAHITDAATSKSDGQLKGETPFQSVLIVDATKTNGVTTDAILTDGLFQLTSATSDFVTDDLQPGDVVEITSVTDQGVYEIQSVTNLTTLVLFQEPGVAITTGSSLAFTTKTRVRSPQVADVSTADVDSSTGTLTSASSTFTTDGVVAGDMAVISAGDATVIGVYKVISADSQTVLTVNTEDQVLTAQTNQTMTVYRPGMHLQYKSVDATPVTGINIAFNDNGGSADTIDRASGSFITDGYVHGMNITITGAADAGNNGTFTINTVAALTLTLIATDSLTTAGSAAGVTISGNVGFVRTLNQVDYSFNWRLFGNGGTLAECFQYIQRELRRGTDIDEASTASRGDITNLLMSFASPTGTTTNLFIDDLSSSDANNATFKDGNGTSRNFAFIAGVTITLSSTLTEDTSAKVVVFFTDADGTPASGDEFGTVGAIIVKDDTSTDMSDVSPLTSPLSFQFDYDNNAQGGRTPGTNAAVTVVGIGLDSAQYVQVTGNILRQNNNVFALVSALERNYSNP